MSLIILVVHIDVGCGGRSLHRTYFSVLIAEETDCSRKKNQGRPGRSISKSVVERHLRCAPYVHPGKVVIWTVLLVLFLEHERLVLKIVSAGHGRNSQ